MKYTEKPYSLWMPRWNKFESLHKFALSNISGELFEAFERRIETIMTTKAYDNKISNYTVNKKVIKIYMVTVETTIIKGLNYT